MPDEAAPIVSSPATGFPDRSGRLYSDLVEDAQVTGSWSNGASGSSSCPTLSDGACTVTKDNIGNKKESVTFSVDNITHATFEYDASQNVQTSITVPQPAQGQSLPLAGAWASLGLATFFFGGIAGVGLRSAHIRKRGNNS